MEAKEIERKYEAVKAEMRGILVDIETLIKEIKASPARFYPGGDEKIVELDMWREEIKIFLA